MDLESREPATFDAPARVPPPLGKTPARKRIVAHAVDSPRRSALEEFVRLEFSAHFAAELREFMPQLLALQDDYGRFDAVVGCRAAAGGALFLERYTRAPIERLIARHAGASVARADVVEIGSLACRGGRAAIELISALVPILIDAGFAWVAFTGADTVKNVFRRMHLHPTVLCKADRAFVGGGATDWGRYYEHDPEVMVGRLREGAAILGSGQPR
jgi:hypothetical protein